MVHVNFSRLVRYHPIDEYFKFEGGIYYLVDAINDYFSDVEKVAIRSSFPDEDIHGRNPGFYLSGESLHLGEEGRREALDLVSRVWSSYYTPKAKERRKRLGLEEKGPSLLVQERIPKVSFYGIRVDSVTWQKS